MEDYGDFVLFLVSAFAAVGTPGEQTRCWYWMTCSRGGEVVRDWTLDPFVDGEGISPMRDATMVARGRMTAANPFSYWWGNFQIVRTCQSFPSLDWYELVLDEFEQPCIHESDALPWTRPTAICPPDIA